MRDERRLCAAVFAASLLLYLAFRSAYFNFDGVACAVAVELDDFKHLAHGNHVAYGLLGWAFHESLMLLGYQGRALLSLQLLDALLGAAGAAAFASLLLRAGRPPREAGLAAAALAVSHAWWFWSLEAQVYMLGALFAALAAREALGEKPRAVWVGLWAGCAALGHVGHLMAVPALLWRSRERRSLALALAGTLAAGYLLGALAVRPATAEQWRLWLLGSAALGVDRGFDWHGAAPAQALRDWSLNTLRVFADYRAAWWGVFLGLVPLAAAARAALARGPVERFWLLWLAGYAALFMAWEPATIVYRVSDLLGLWFLASAVLRGPLLAAWTASALAFNLAFTVLPAADPRNNPDAVETEWTAARVPRDAWVLAYGRPALYLPYFEGIKPVNLRYFRGADALRARVRGLGEVYVTSRTLALAPEESGVRRLTLEKLEERDGLALYRAR